MEVLAPSQSLLEKLQLKDEKNLLIQGLPSTVEKQFVKLSFSKNVTPLLKSRKIDFALVFAISHKQLEDILRDVVPALHPEAKLWIAYPKVSSKIVSDLSRDCNWSCITRHGLEGVRMIALDNIWTAMRFKKADPDNKVKVLNSVPGIDVELREVVAPEDLESATLQLAERLRAAPPIALAAAKHAVYMSQAAELEEMLRYETEAQLRCFDSDDAHEGVHAFLEKREPRFTGH